MFSLLSAFDAIAENEDAGSLRFDLNPDGKSYTVSWSSLGSGSSSQLEIPAYHEGLPVTEMGDFQYANFTSIVVPENVTTIRSSSFSHNHNVKNIKLPNSLIKIDLEAFSNCAFLTSIEIPKNVTYIGDYAFERTSIAAIEIPENVTYIGYNAFADCTSLKTVKFPTISNSGISFGLGTFRSCSELSEINLPEGIETISESMFSNCSKLKSIHIPASVTEIGGNAFAWSGIESIDLPSSINKIKYGTFCSCPLEHITIPPTVKTIEDFAFDTCGFLEAIELPNTLDSIGYMAFSGSGLISINIPNTVTHIGKNAFSGCKALNSVAFGTGITEIKDYTFAGCHITKPVLPPQITKIGSNAFAGNYIVELTIGNKMLEIGKGAFGDAFESLQNIHITTPEPPTAFENTFSGYAAQLWLQDQDAIDRYAISQPCWYNFERKPMICAEKLEKEYDELTLEPGSTRQLEVTVKPENATLKNIFWRSTNPNIASIDNNGLVTFHDTIAFAFDNGQKAPTLDCKIIAYTLYDNGPTAEFTIKAQTTSVVDVIVDKIETDKDNPVEVFDISGKQVSDSTEGLAPGLYILRHGSSARKIAVN